MWLERKRAGTLRRPSFAELFTPALRRTTIVTTALSACAYAAAFGSLQLTADPGGPGLAAHWPGSGGAARRSGRRRPRLNKQFNEVTPKVRDAGGCGPRALAEVVNDRTAAQPRTSGRPRSGSTP